MRGGGSRTARLPPPPPSPASSASPEISSVELELELELESRGSFRQCLVPERTGTEPSRSMLGSGAKGQSHPEERIFALDPGRTRSRRKAERTRRARCRSGRRGGAPEAAELGVRAERAELGAEAEPRWRLSSGEGGAGGARVTPPA